MARSWLPGPRGPPHTELWGLSGFSGSRQFCQTWVGGSIAFCGPLGWTPEMLQDTRGCEPGQRPPLTFLVQTAKIQQLGPKGHLTNSWVGRLMPPSAEGKRLIRGSVRLGHIPRPRGDPVEGAGGRGTCRLLVGPPSLTPSLPPPSADWDRPQQDGNFCLKCLNLSKKECGEQGAETTYVVSKAPQEATDVQLGLFLLFYKDPSGASAEQGVRKTGRGWTSLAGTGQLLPIGLALAHLASDHLSDLNLLRFPGKFSILFTFSMYWHKNVHGVLKCGPVLIFIPKCGRKPPRAPCPILVKRSFTLPFPNLWEV